MALHVYSVITSRLRFIQPNFGDKIYNFDRSYLLIICYGSRIFCYIISYMCYDCLRATRVTILHFSNGITHITLSFIYCPYIQRSLQSRRHRILDLFKLANIDYWNSSGFQHRVLGFLICETHFML
jgi:hypothetical protein